MESHNNTVNLYKGESHGDVQPALIEGESGEGSEKGKGKAGVACREILDPSLLVVADAAGIRDILTIFCTGDVYIVPFRFL